MALRAHKASLLAVVRAAVLMFLNTRGQGKTTAHRLRIDEAVKVNPLSAIQRPRLSAKSLANSPREDCLLKRSQVLTGHTSNALINRAFGYPFALSLFAPC